MTDRPDPPAPDEDFLVLVVRYFDGDLGPEELAELNARLRTDPESRRTFAEYATRVSLVREATGPERQRTDLLTTPAGHQPAAARPNRRRATWLAAAGLVAVAAALAVGVWLFTRAPEPAGPSVVAVVEPAAGGVYLVGPDGVEFPVEFRTVVRPGDTVRTEGLRGTAAVVYTDGTRLTLVGDTMVTCTGSVPKTVRLHAGSVAAVVTPQPADGPMVLITPTARVEVLGTEFHCRAFPDWTDVSVTRGLVRVVRTSNAAAVEVPAGHRVSAGGRVPLAVEAVPVRGETWELDFEQGLPAGMRRGRFVAEGLPRGSRGGVAAIESRQPGLAGYFEIASPEEWQRGLFAFHPDSHLHVTYKMDRPDWVNVFVCARGPDPNGPHVGNYLFNGPELHTPPRPGRWRTISIPLAGLRRAGLNHPDGPGPDEVPYLVLFSSQGDRGLVVDRVWVTRGGPGAVRVVDIE